MTATELSESILRKCRESAATQGAFFRAHAERIVSCCRDVAAAFDRGARLLVMGNGGSSCDAQHMALEFAHPIVEKRPAFPAIALGRDAALLTAIGNDQDFSLALAKEIRLLGRAGDVALGISTSGVSANVVRALRAARELGMLTIGFAGKDGGKLPEACDHCFIVPSYSIHRIQETHVALLHLLWDMVHVIRGEEDVL